MTLHWANIESAEAMARMLHELNNVTDAARRFLRLALRDIDAQDPAVATRRITRALTLLDRLDLSPEDLTALKVSFSSSAADISGALLIETIFEEVEERAARQGVRLVARGADHPISAAHVVVTEHILRNLVHNALEAQPGGGSIVVSASRSSTQSVWRVEDTGPGLGAVGERVFEPFFTTRAEGTGLGLAICRDWVESCGGAIVASNTESGACFEFSVPVIHERFGEDT
jgi:signal transduction histidine kinase